MIQLSNGLILVSVPKDAMEFELQSNEIKMVYDNEIHRMYKDIDFNNYKILGTITAESCDFDCMQFIEDSEFYAKMWKNYNPIGKPSARSNQCPRPIDSFKSLIEAETDYLFENNLPYPNYKNPKYNKGELYDVFEDVRNWQSAQDRVVEKILILKEI